MVAILIRCIEMSRQLMKKPVEASLPIQTTPDEYDCKDDAEEEMRGILSNSWSPLSSQPDEGGAIFNERLASSGDIVDTCPGNTKTRLYPHHIPIEYQQGIQPQQSMPSHSRSNSSMHPTDETIAGESYSSSSCSILHHEPEYRTEPGDDTVTYEHQYHPIDYGNYHGRNFYHYPDPSESHYSTPHERHARSRNEPYYSSEPDYLASAHHYPQYPYGGRHSYYDYRTGGSHHSRAASSSSSNPGPPKYLYPYPHAHYYNPHPSSPQIHHYSNHDGSVEVTSTNVTTEDSTTPHSSIRMQTVNLAPSLCNQKPSARRLHPSNIHQEAQDFEPIPLEKISINPVLSSSSSFGSGHTSPYSYPRLVSSHSNNTTYTSPHAAVPVFGSRRSSSHAYVAPPRSYVPPFTPASVKQVRILEPSSGGSNETSSSSSWEKRFNELIDFKRFHGHCEVPQNYAENASLGTWVNKQRMEQKNRLEGKSSSLTDSRFERLQAVGFRWAKRKGQASWDEKFNELKLYKAKFGNCHVPTKYKANSALGRWVSTQRAEYKKYSEGGTKTSMNPEKVRRLEEIGFAWFMAL